jgi:hypothetical protein
MTDAQIFQLFGLAYLVMGIGGVIKRDAYIKLMDDFSKSMGLLFITGLLTITVGFLLVAFHNVWVMGWTVIITIFGWIALIKGIVILMFPGFYFRIFDSLKKRKTLMSIYPIIVILISIFLLLLGFGVF